MQHRWKIERQTDRGKQKKEREKARRDQVKFCFVHCHTQCKYWHLRRGKKGKGQVGGHSDSGFAFALCELGRGLWECLDNFLKCASSNFEAIWMSSYTLYISMASPLCEWSNACADVEAEMGLFPLLAHFCISPRVVTLTRKRWIWELQERPLNVTSVKGFASMVGLKNHVQSDHKKAKELPKIHRGRTIEYNCPYPECNKSLPSAREVKQHLEKEHRKTQALL